MHGTASKTNEQGAPIIGEKSRNEAQKLSRILFIFGLCKESMGEVGDGRPYGMESVVESCSKTLKLYMSIYSLTEMMSLKHLYNEIKVRPLTYPVTYYRSHTCEKSKKP
eukprot:Tbor_TRINITY_DN5011_c0_g8::TRINITY_DN5011_c0_g8_i1::g.14388::m.14388